MNPITNLVYVTPTLLSFRLGVNRPDFAEAAILSPIIDSAFDIPLSLKVKYEVGLYANEEDVLKTYAPEGERRWSRGPSRFYFEQAVFLFARKYGLSFNQENHRLSIDKEHFYFQTIVGAIEEPSAHPEIPNISCQEVHETLPEYTTFLRIKPCDPNQSGAYERKPEFKLLEEKLNRFHLDGRLHGISAFLSETRNLRTSNPVLLGVEVALTKNYQFKFLF